jgi:hypothetical protein
MLEFWFDTFIWRSDSNKSQPSDVFLSPVPQDKSGNSAAIVKSSNEITKTTPAGEYLTSALMDFDPDQFEGFAAVADGANKLLMLVSAKQYSIWVSTIKFYLQPWDILLEPLEFSLHFNISREWFWQC